MSSRKDIVKRTIARMKARGFAIDDDPEFMALLELWIEGVVDAETMRGRHDQLMRAKMARRRKARSDISRSDDAPLDVVNENAPEERVERAPVAQE